MIYYEFLDEFLKTEQEDWIEHDDIYVYAEDIEITIEKSNDRYKLSYYRTPIARVVLVPFEDIYVPDSNDDELDKHIGYLMSNVTKEAYEDAVRRYRLSR